MITPKGNGREMTSSEQGKCHTSEIQQETIDEESLRHILHLDSSTFNSLKELYEAKRRVITFGKHPEDYDEDCC